MRYPLFVDLFSWRACNFVCTRIKTGGGREVDFGRPFFFGGGGGKGVQKVVDFDGAFLGGDGGSEIRQPKGCLDVGGDFFFKGGVVKDPLHSGFGVCRLK